MQQFLHSTHSIIRWLVLLGGILAMVLPFLTNNENVTKMNALPALFYMIICDVQILVGFPLYFFYSSYGASAFHNGVSNVMNNEDLRRIAVEHFGLTIIAFFFVHVGYFKIRRAIELSRIKRISIIYFGISIVLILASVPWHRILV